MNMIFVLKDDDENDYFNVASQSFWGLVLLSLSKLLGVASPRRKRGSQ